MYKNVSGFQKWSEHFGEEEILPMLEIKLIR